MVYAKILAVDQDQAAYEALLPDLSRHGYELHPVASPSKAVDLAAAHDYHAALVSISLLDDHALLADLRDAIPNLPIILALYAGQGSIPSQVLKLVTNVVGKPLSFDPVRLMLDRTLELAALRAQLREERHMLNLNDILQITLDGVDGASLQMQGLWSETLVSRLHRLVRSVREIGSGSIHHTVLSCFERLLLAIVLAECRGNQVKSAAILGINRNTLRKKISALGLSDLRSRMPQQ
jgi:DNA-binding NtrC family response regulator